MGNFRGNFGGFGGGFGGANIQQLMKQAQKMQEDLQVAKDELIATEFKAVSGGGMVEVSMMGDRTLKSIKFKPEVVDPDDVEMLEDLTMAAINDVLSQIAKAESDKIPQVPGM